MKSVVLEESDTGGEEKVKWAGKIPFRHSSIFYIFRYAFNYRNPGG